MNELAYDRGRLLRGLALAALGWTVLAALIHFMPSLTRESSWRTGRHLSVAGGALFCGGIALLAVGWRWTYQRNGPSWAQWAFVAPCALVIGALGLLLVDYARLL